MIAVLTVLLVLTMSLVVVRVATVGLTLTGLSKDLAQFQALSAFTGSGFTTRESEEIVNHPIRRRIVMHLMLLGNAGIVLVIASVLKFFLAPQADDKWYESQPVRLGLLAAGIGVLWIAANSTHVETVMWRIHKWALSRWTKIDVYDYTRLLRLAKDYAVWELRVQKDDWVQGKTLAELALASEGVLVLGLERRDGPYVGSPRGATMVSEGDLMILYGPQESLMNLDARRVGFAGNMDHVIAVTRELEARQQVRK